MWPTPIDDNPFDRPLFKEKEKQLANVCQCGHGMCFHGIYGCTKFFCGCVQYVKREFIEGDK